MIKTIDDWLLKNLVDPIQKTPLSIEGNLLKSTSGRTYPVVDGIPIMLVEDARQTISVAQQSMDAASGAERGGRISDPYFIDTLGISESEKSNARSDIASGAIGTDPVIAALVGATNGIAYKSSVNQLGRVPIPTIPAQIALPPQGHVLDVGCNWGRWSMALSNAGIPTIVGIDPSLGAVAAARRMAERMQVNFIGVVGDARYLPFADGSLSHAFSYSVLQHFSRDDAKLAVAELARSVREGGVVAVQMPNRWGIRCFLHQAKRGFSDGSDFSVRYYSVAELKSLFGKIGPVDISIDCFFGLGLQATDLDLMSPLAQNATRVSEWLKRTAGVKNSWAAQVADSVWCRAENTGRSVSHSAGSFDKSAPGQH